MTTYPTKLVEVALPLDVIKPRGRTGKVDPSRPLGRAALKDLPPFTVEDKVWCRTLPTTISPIVQDLRIGSVAYAESDLVAALAGVPAAKSSVRARNGAAEQISGRPTLPTAVQGPAAYLLHDADASQEAAVRLALAGRDLVIEGPPGTGKSQTIANVIASAILTGNHKSVLFLPRSEPRMTGIEDLRRKPSEKP